ncbi:MAG TPA: TldD/PmbA family protein [Bacteroidota bacterium]|nr:TldD/PmbA family protein [Bacteroidota bacterium]
MTQDQAKQIFEKILTGSSADALRISINDGKTSNVRFARNTVTTSGTAQDTSISITATFGKRTGSYSVNQFDEKTLTEAVKKAEELARLAPEDPEYMPPLEPQTYLPIHAQSPDTEKFSPDSRASIAKECVGMAGEKSLVAAGFVEQGKNFAMIGNNKGLFAARDSTNISYSVTARTKDGTGSGWAGGGHTDVTKLESSSISKRAIEKGIASMNPGEVSPGKYTVILEAEAVSNLLGTFGFRMDARSADEGRSYFSEKGGANKLGMQVFPEFVNLTSDPADPDAPGAPWGEDGMPTRKTAWIENGVVKNLRYSRFWAQKQGKEPVPAPANLILRGGNASLEDLISSTEKGILVTRFWYIRDVDPMSMLMTGLTRDGTFWIENGKIVRPVKNFRFNESPVAMLKNIQLMSKPVRIQNGPFANLIPALKVKEFTFSSLSDAV